MIEKLRGEDHSYCSYEGIRSSWTRKYRQYACSHVEDQSEHISSQYIHSVPKPNMLLNYLIPYMLFHNLLYLLVYNNMFALLLILYYLLVYMFYLLMGLLFLHFLHMDHFLRLYLVELLWLHLLVLHLLLLLFVHHIVVDNDYSYLYMSLFLYILLH